MLANLRLPLTHQDLNKNPSTKFSLFFGDCGLKHSPPRLITQQQQQRQTDSYFLGSVKRNDCHFHVIVGLCCHPPNPPLKFSATLIKFFSLRIVLISLQCSQTQGLSLPEPTLTITQQKQTYFVFLATNLKTNNSRPCKEA